MLLYLVICFVMKRIYSYFTSFFNCATWNLGSGAFGPEEFVYSSVVPYSLIVRFPLSLSNIYKTANFGSILCIHRFEVPARFVWLADSFHIFLQCLLVGIYVQPTVLIQQTFKALWGSNYVQYFSDNYRRHCGALNTRWIASMHFWQFVSLWSMDMYADTT